MLVHNCSRFLGSIQLYRKPGVSLCYHKVAKLAYNDYVMFRLKIDNSINMFYRFNIYSNKYSILDTQS